MFHRFLIKFSQFNTSKRGRAKKNRSKAPTNKSPVLTDLRIMEEIKMEGKIDSVSFKSLKRLSVRSSL